jgi:uncharacterized protein YqjF (DUF2071 family)
MAMTPAGELEMARQDLDAVAWKFLSSEFTGPVYADWPIDRRVEAYLLHHGMMGLVNDGGTYAVLLDRIMANIGPALRRGVLAPPHS